MAYYNEATSQVAPPPEDAITTKYRQVAVTQVNMEERDQGAEEENIPAVESAAVSTPCKENHSHDKEIMLDIDLNKTPQPKPKRRKHRPKVITEGKPKRTRKPVTPKPVQSKENSTGKRKYAGRKELNTISPQTEVTGEWTKPLMPESGKKSCRRSLNFDIGEQPRDGNFACRENATTHFGGEIGIEVKETQALNNHMPLQEGAQASTTALSKSNSPGARLNANYGENGSKRWGWMIDKDGHESSAQILSKSVAQSSPNDSDSNNRKLMTTGSQVVCSKRKQPGTIENADCSSINLIGMQYNLVQAYPPKDWVQFSNVRKKRRSQKGKISNTFNTSSVTATKDAQLATCPQEDARSHPYASTSYSWISGSEYETVRVPVILTDTDRAIHDKSQSLEYNLSLGQRRPTKRRSRVPTRIHDCASLTLIRNCDTKAAHTTRLGSSDRQAFGDAERPQTCIEALVAEMRASLTKKKRSKKSTPVSSVHSCTNEMQQHHKSVLEDHSLPLHNSLGISTEISIFFCQWYYSYYRTNNSTMQFVLIEPLMQTLLAKRCGETNILWIR